MAYNIEINQKEEVCLSIPDGGDDGDRAHLYLTTEDATDLALDLLQAVNSINRSKREEAKKKKD